MKKYSVVIPVFKSSRSLETITCQFIELERSLNCSFELIFVNDSPFHIETCKTLELIKKNTPSVRVVTLRKNQGQHLATIIGLKYAEGEYVITMDDDLQHPVSEIPKLIQAMYESPETEAFFAVFPFSSKKHNLFRRLSGSIFTHIDFLFMKKPFGLTKSTFRIMTHDMAQHVTKNYHVMPSVSSIMINMSHHIKNIDVAHSERKYGTSNYTLKKMISLSLNHIVYYTSLPLKVIGIMGFIGFIFSMFFIVYIIIRKILWSITFPGYASTVILISFFGGLNLFATGIIGEYLIRIVKEQNKPELTTFVKKVI